MASWRSTGNMLPDLSLHVLDIAQNSIQAGADLIRVELKIFLQSKRFRLVVSDNGCGMDQEQLNSVTDPFFTSRKTRRVGLGVPFLKQSAECTGGSFSIESQIGRGTRLAADYHMDHIDCIPLGDMAETILALVTTNIGIDFEFTYGVDDKSFVFDTREIKDILSGLPFYSGEVRAFMMTFLNENLAEANSGTDL